MHDDTESWSDWIAGVRKKFHLPALAELPVRLGDDLGYWRGYEACLQDVERRVAGLDDA